MAARATRTFDLELNKFGTIPPALVDPKTKAPVAFVTAEVKALFHHYFLAKYGEGVEDRGEYEYEQQLTAGTDWRFKGSGIGADKESKKHVSNEIAKGFARWFHYEHLGFTYFCPFEDLLDRKNVDGSVWRRKEDGDLPDYVCGESERHPNLLEVKGRYRAMSFKRKEFDGYRQQIQRAELVDGNGAALQVKGFISVSRWATEETPRVRTKLLVEDPTTEGDPPSPDGYPRGVGRAMIAGHYIAALARLHLPLFADAIREGRTVPEQATARRRIWECIDGPLAGRRFVGGILAEGAGTGAWGPWSPYIWAILDEFGPRPWRQLWRMSDAPFVLSPPMRFFGVEQATMRVVKRIAREGLEAAASIEPTVVPEDTGSLSLLRDGTVLGPADYFEPVGVMEL